MSNFPATSSSLKFSISSQNLVQCWGDYRSLFSCFQVFQFPPCPSLNGLSSKQNNRNERRIAISCRNEKLTGVPTSKKKNFPGPIFSEGRDEDEDRLICPGCGVFMQDKNSNLPGYYIKRIAENNENKNILSISDDLMGEIHGETDEYADDDSYEGKEDSSDNDNDIDSSIDGDDWDFELEEEDEKLEMDFDGFGPADVGYGNITDETLNKGRKRISKSERKKKAREARKSEEEMITVCARCHSLRYYGQVKNENVENLIPDFDFDRFIATRLLKLTKNSNSSVVVIVVDCVDFDGSFPKRAAKSLFKALQGSKKETKSSNFPKIVLVATKVDLLPSQVSPTRLDRWVRNRAKAGGTPKLNGVYLVSARKDIGVRNLLSFIKEIAGPRGNVWVIGSQNAGKSTLINALAKKEGAKLTRLTEASVPGTTLGILRIGGILPAKAKMYDTPGLLHPFLITGRLSREEQKMVEIRKELRPRTYRIKAGQTIHVGGLVRLDLMESSVETIYVTVWSSPNISLHLGKIENAEEIWKKHGGVRLQPPIGEERISALGELKPREIKVSGNTWEVNSVDIAVAGFGWFSIGLKGNATVSLWTFEGIDVTVREPLVLDRSPVLERAGFLLPKAISDGIAAQSKLAREKESDEKIPVSIGTDF